MQKFCVLACSFALFIQGFGGALHLDLDDSMHLALEKNPFLLEMKELVKQAKSGKTEAFTKWFPKIEGSYYMYRDQRANPLSGSRNNFLTQLSLTQSILSTTKYFGLKLAELQLRQMQLLYDAALNDVIYDVRSQYFRLVADKQMVYTAKQRVQLLTNLAKQMQDRFNIGTAKQYSVNQSQVAVANAMQQYYQTQKILKTDLDRFAEILGYDPGTVNLIIKDEEIPVKKIPQLKSKLAQVEKIFTDLGNLAPIYLPEFPSSQESKMRNVFSKSEVGVFEQQALTSNPLLLSKLTELSIANEKLNEQWGTYLPEVQVLANLGGIPDPFEFFPTSTFSSQVMRWGLGLEVSWLLFDSFGRESRVNQAKYERNSKEFALKKEKQDVLFAVRDQLHSIEESISTYVTSSGNVRLADQTLLQAQEQLEIGYIDLFDYQISVDGLIEAKNNLSQSGFQLIDAYYGLIHAMGSDIQTIGQAYGTNRK